MITSRLNDLLKAANEGIDIFLIKDCAKAIDVELQSMSMPGIKMELAELIANSENADEAESLRVIF